MSNRMLAFVVALVFSCSGLNADEESFLEFSQAVSILLDVRVSEDFGMTTEQYENIKKFADENDLRTRLFQLQLEIRKARGTPEYAIAIEKADAFTKKVNAEFNESLLDFQFERVAQFVAQRNLGLHLPTSGLLNDEIARHYRLDENARSKLRKLDLEIEKEIINLHKEFKKTP